MRTPTQAVLWELWRTSRLQLLMVVGSQFAFVLLVFSLAFTIKHKDEFTMQVIGGMYVMWSTAASAFSQSWRNSFESGYIGFSFHQGFTRPISTTRLVALPMLFIVITAPLCYLLPTLLFNGLLRVAGYSDSVPLVGPALLTACVAACLVAIAWSPTTIVGKASGLVACVVVLLASLAAYHVQRDDPEPLIMAVGKPGYFDFAWYHYLVLLTIPVLMLGVTVVAVERQRHGDRWQLDGFRRWRRGLSVPAAGNLRRNKPFRSQLSAQCWYEMRRFGIRLLILSLLAPLLPLAMVTFGSLAYPGRDGAPWFWLVAIGFCPLAYQMIGVDGAIGLRQKQGALQFSAFDATRAMRNDQLIAIKLLLIASCSLVGWLWMVLAAGAHAVATGDGQWWIQLGNAVSENVGDVSVQSWIARGCAAVLLYISSTSLLFALGLWFPLYSGFFSCLSIAAIGHVVLAIWDFKHGLGLRYFWMTEGWLLAAAMVLGSVFALHQALSSGFLGKRLFGCMFCLWAIYVSTAIATFINTPAGVSIPLVVIALGAANLIVPLASAAIAPLALASHRHG